MITYLIVIRFIFAFFSKGEDIVFATRIDASTPGKKMILFQGPPGIDKLGLIATSSLLTSLSSIKVYNKNGVQVLAHSNPVALSNNISTGGQPSFPIYKECIAETYVFHVYIGPHPLMNSENKIWFTAFDGDYSIFVGTLDVSRNTWPLKEEWVYFTACEGAVTKLKMTASGDDAVQISKVRFYPYDMSIIDQMVVDKCISSNTTADWENDVTEQVICFPVHEIPLQRYEVDIYYGNENNPSNPIFTQGGKIQVSNFINGNLWGYQLTPTPGTGTSFSNSFITMRLDSLQLFQANTAPTLFSYFRVYEATKGYVRKEVARYQNRNGYERFALTHHENNDTRLSKDIWGEGYPDIVDSVSISVDPYALNGRLFRKSYRIDIVPLDRFKYRIEMEVMNKDHLVYSGM